MALAVALGLVLMPAGSVHAQGQDPTEEPVVPILTIESERFFAESAFGQRVAAEIEAASAELAAENRRIEGALTQEEQDLTRRRAEMDPVKFRTLADEFDERVQRIRREQEAKARALAEGSEAGRVAFLRAARPVLGQLMREAGASVILERGSVFFSSNASDITEAAVTRIDAAIGDGAQLDVPAPTTPPTTAGPSTGSTTGPTADPTTDPTVPTSPTDIPPVTPDASDNGANGANGTDEVTGGSILQLPDDGGTGTASDLQP